jgi:hypothetical protein|uniref:KIB1-4 beta-propeller domain-containing protein n=1 Tax=Fagus sylvatica TaxID=28930 RepID=A0A2N9GCE6_FAGSY
MALSSLESDWAWLPRNLLNSILDKVASSPFDLVRFGVVCKPWRTVEIEYIQEKRRMKGQGNQVPMLLIPTKYKSKRARSLYSITEQKIYHCKLRMPYNKRCCGSSFGWLSFVTDTFSITLFNPLKNMKIHLPQLTKIKEPIYLILNYQYSVYKLTLSSDPAKTPTNCLVVAIYGSYNKLAFMKLGAESWTYVDEELNILFSDILFFKGQVLALGHHSGLVSIDVNSNEIKILVPNDLEYAIQTYLVETCSGDLLLVRRFFDPNNRYSSSQSLTGSFKVYKFVLDDESGQVLDRVEVKTIGDNALFLGDNYSISVLATESPGCQPNSIYYTDDYIDTKPYYPDGAVDMGIFNLLDGSIQQHYKPKSSIKRMPPPIWIILRL